MNYGHFYHLNTEKSDLTQKVAIFDYKGIVPKEAGNHHVYVIIIDDGVHFEYHYYNNEVASHIHTDIAFWPFSSSAHVHDRLSQIIEDCHDVTFPDEIDHASENPVRIHNPLTNSIINSGGYSGLNEIFNIGKPEDNGNIIRRMILDFLFDLEHSTVFQVSSFYGQVKRLLHTDSLTSAILARAEYYYQRKQQQEKDYILNNNFRAQLIYANDYTLAERQWVDFLCSEHADMLLAESAWLRTKNKPSHVSQELNLVYKSRESSLAVCDYIHTINPQKEEDEIKKAEIHRNTQHTAQRALSAYLHRYDLIGACNIFFEYGFPFIRSMFPSAGLQDLLLPRLMGAIFMAWFTLLRYLDIFSSSNNAIGYCIGIVLVLLLYVYYEIRKKNRFLPFKIIAFRELILLFVSFAYSILIGNCLFVLSHTKYHLESGFLLTTIAVFIGIFINMLFEDRSITES